jgi:hypothetical protein
VPRLIPVSVMRTLPALATASVMPKSAPQNVWMLQRGDRLDLAEEALGADDRGELGTQHLDRDLASMLEIFGEVDRGHAALADLALDSIATGERILKAGDRLGHLCIGMGG